MTETWEQRLLRLLDPDQVRRGDAAIVAAIDNLPSRLAEQSAGAGSSAAGSAGPSVIHSPITSQWRVGAGASQTKLPVRVAHSGQTPVLTPQVRAGLVGATLTVTSGANAGQSSQILDVSPTGVLTLRDPLPSVSGPGDTIDLATTPALTGVAGTSTWLDTWIEAGHSLNITSPWNGTIALSNIDQALPLHLVVGTGFTGSISASLSGGGEIDLGIDCALTMTLPPASASATTASLNLFVGPNCSGTVSASGGFDGVTARLGAGFSGSLDIGGAAVNVVVLIGDGCTGTVSVAGAGDFLLVVGNTNTGALNMANAGDAVVRIADANSGPISFPNLGDAVVDIGLNNASTVSGSTGDSVITIGQESAGTVTITGSDLVLEVGGNNAGNFNVSGSDCMVRVGTNNVADVTVSGPDNLVEVGANNLATVSVAGGYGVIRVAEGGYGTIATQSGASQSFIDIGPLYRGSLNLGTSTGATVRFGPASSGSVTTGSTGSSLVGQNTWWAALSGTLADGSASPSLASGAALSGGWFDLAGWGGALAQATVSGTSPAYTLEVTVADVGHHPFYTATATGSATTAALGPFVSGPAVQLVVTNTGTNALTVQDLGFLLTPPGMGGGAGGSSGGTASSVTVSNFPADQDVTLKAQASGLTLATKVAPTPFANLTGATVTAGAAILSSAYAVPGAGSVVVSVGLASTASASPFGVSLNGGTDYYYVNQNAALSAGALYDFTWAVDSGSTIQFACASATTVGALQAFWSPSV